MVRLLLSIFLSWVDVDCSTGSWPCFEGLNCIISPGFDAVCSG